MADRFARSLTPDGVSLACSRGCFIWATIRLLPARAGANMQLKNALVAAVVSTALLSTSASAQNGTYYQPLNQRTPLGESAGWLTHIRGHQSTWLQPVQIGVPGGAEVSVYSGSAQPDAITSSPARVSIVVSSVS